MLALTLALAMVVRPLEVPFARATVPATELGVPRLSAPLMVVAGLIVTAPVDTLPMPIVPVPLALMVRLLFEPLSIVEIATVPPVAAPATFSPATADPADASTLKVGFVTPFGPTDKEVPDVAVTITSVVKVGLLDSTIFPVPVTAFVSVTPPYVSAELSVRGPGIVAPQGDVNVLAENVPESVLTPIEQLVTVAPIL